MLWRTTSLVPASWDAVATPWRCLAPTLKTEYHHPTLLVLCAQQTHTHLPRVGRSGVMRSCLPTYFNIPQRKETATERNARAGPPLFSVTRGGFGRMCDAPEGVPGENRKPSLTRRCRQSIAQKIFDWNKYQNNWRRDFFLIKRWLRKTEKLGPEQWWWSRIFIIIIFIYILSMGRSWW